LIPHRKAAGQIRRPEHRALQRHSGFALFVQLVDALQALTESSSQHRQQIVILGSERPVLRQLDPDDQHP
jgi:hypothetical protein